MKPVFYKFCLAITLVILFWQDAGASEIVVISNLDVSVSAEEVEDIYTGEKQFSGSILLSPVDNAALQERFLKAFMQMDNVKYNRIWVRKLFRDGLAAPEMKPGDAEVIGYVRRTSGAIGYVSSVPLGVRVIRKLSVQ